jgi:L-asparaginase II
MNISFAEIAPPPAEVVVTRGERVESVHAVLVAVVDADGRRIASARDRARPVYFRSAAKPFQALPLVEDGVARALPLTGEELALCCASHNAEPRHVEVALGILAKAGVGEEALACGAHSPLATAAAERLLRSGVAPSRVHNNCSGKHAGMLALARAHGWPAEGYHLAGHPVQQRMLEEAARWTGLEPADVAQGVDGCGVVSFAVPLERMALAFARFARAADREEGAAAIVGAMTRHPWMVAGSGRLCTALMERAGKRVFVKTGAEGVYCAGVRGQGVGVAVKVLDGAKRAADAALVRVLELLGVLGPDDVASVSDFVAPLVRNTRGEVVGELSARFTLAGARAEMPVP